VPKSHVTVRSASFAIQLPVAQLFTQAPHEVRMRFAPCQRAPPRFLQSFVVRPFREQRPHPRLLEHVLQEPGLDGRPDLIVAIQEECGRTSGLGIRSFDCSALLIDRVSSSIEQPYLSRS